MSSYVPTDWVDGTTPLNEANLDKIEQALTKMPYGPGFSNGRVPVWNGSAWANQFIFDGQIAPTAAIAISKLKDYPTDPTKFLRGDGTWAVVAAGGGGGTDWEGAWAAGTAYVKGDVVTYQGVTYVAVNDSTGQTPPSASPVGAAVTPVPLVTALPSSPFDGQEVYLVDSLTAPTYQWHLRYVAAKATNKWVLVGGGGYIKAEENTTEPTYTSFSWVDLGPPNVSVTVPVTGLWAIEFLATLTAAAASTRYIAVKLGAAATQQADGIVTTTSPHGNMRYLERQLSAGDVLKFQVQTSASTITVRIPFWLRIRPVAVGG